MVYSIYPKSDSEDLSILTVFLINLEIYLNDHSNYDDCIQKEKL